MGISAIVDSNGRVLMPVANERGDWVIPDDAGSLPVSRWHEFKKVSGVVVGRIPIDSRGSVYAWLGDAFAIACLGAMVLAVLVARIIRPNEPEALGCEKN